MGGWVGKFLFFGCGLVAFSLFVRFLYWRVEQNLRRLAQLEEDPEARAQALAELDAQIATKERDPELRLRRANLRRFDKNYTGVLDDLLVYTQLRPQDDSGWAELADAYLLLERPHEALEAIDKALGFDPSYTDYYPLKIHAALACNDTDIATQAVDTWREMWLRWRTQKQQTRGNMFRTYNPAELPQMDPYVELHAAAVAQRKEDEAALDEALKNVDLRKEGISREDLDAVPVLRPLLTTQQVRAQLGDGDQQTDSPPQDDDNPDAAE